MKVIVEFFYDSHKIQLEHFLKIYEGISIFRQRATEKLDSFLSNIFAGILIGLFLYAETTTSWPPWLTSPTFKHRK